MITTGVMLAAVMVAVAAVGCGDDSRTQDSQPDPSDADGWPAESSAPETSGSVAERPDAPRDEQPLVSFTGTIDGTHVTAHASQYQTECLTIDATTTTIVAHHIGWDGDGVEALEALGIAVAHDGSQVERVRLGVLEDSRFTDDLERPLLDYPSLEDLYLTTEDRAEAAAVAWLSLDGRAVSLNGALIDDVDNPADAGTISGILGCDQDSIDEMQQQTPGA